MHQRSKTIFCETKGIDSSIIEYLCVTGMPTGTKKGEKLLLAWLSDSALGIAVLQ